MKPLPFHNRSSGPFAKGFSTMDKPRSSTSLTPESLLKTVGPLSERDLQLERQAIRKLDYTILPIVTLFYLTSSVVCFLFF